MQLAHGLSVKRKAATLKIDVRASCRVRSIGSFCLLSCTGRLSLTRYSRQTKQAQLAGSNEQSYTGTPAIDQYPDFLSVMFISSFPLTKRLALATNWSMASC